MVKFSTFVNKILLIFTILSVICSCVVSINNQCNDNILLLISNENVLLLNFDLQEDSSSSIIYQAKENTTIENGLFNKRTNTILLLINQSNKVYSVILLNIYNNLYYNWREKSNKLIYSTYVYLGVGQRYFYVLNSQLMFLETFTLPLTLKAYERNYLKNLPKNQTVLNYVIDERFQFLWILLENVQIQLYRCQLTTYDCKLHINLFYLTQPIKLSMNSLHQQLYIYSKEYFILFQYNQNQTDYTIHHLNFTEQNQDYFLTECGKSNNFEYVSINYNNTRQVCFQTCQYLPIIPNDTSRIHTVQRISILSDIHRCSKQRQISKIIIVILILTDIAVVLGVIVWLAYKYLHQPTFNQDEKPAIDETIWTSENGYITHF